MTSPSSLTYFPEASKGIGCPVAGSFRLRLVISAKFEALPVSRKSPCTKEDMLSSAKTPVVNLPIRLAYPDCLSPISETSISGKERFIEFTCL
ncbi:hypothetical protein D1872_221890 [compost metagenome]